MKVSGYTYSTYDLPDNGSRAQNTRSLGLDFSNISPEKVEEINGELLNSGKITLLQSVELSIMDGRVFEYENGGMPEENINLYNMIDEEVDYQKKNGIGNIKETVDSYKKLEEALESFQNQYEYKSKNSTIA
jgi:hypothetical protein